MARVLIIEDNPDLAFGLANNLEIEGHRVELVQDGRAGLERAIEAPPELVILDLMLPGMNGYELLRALREAGIEVPVLILSARTEEADKLRGFRLGADDYVTKPFSLVELLARVEALLRRTRGTTRSGHARGGLLRFDQVEVDRDTRTVRKAGRTVQLSPKAFDLLAELLERNGKLASRYDLLKTVWGFHTPVMSRTVDTHIAELRRKLEDDPANPRYILTSRKAGYRIQP